MAEFAWVARAPTGETEKGVMVADTVDAVEKRLRAQQLNPQKKNCLKERRSVLA